MNTETLETEEVHQAVATSTDGKALVNFNVTDLSIAQMQERFMPLRIDGPNDKTGYNAVYAARQLVKDLRCDVEKKRKELNEDALAWQRTVNGEAKRITALMAPIETHLQSQETAYNEERARIARQKELERQERADARTKQLKAYGYEWNAREESYDFIREELGINLRINFDDIKEFSDEEYQPVGIEAETAHGVEVAHIARQIEAKRLNDERLAAEQKAERDRLAAERRELEQQAAEVKRQQDQIEADRRALQEQKDEALHHSRTSRLLAVGFSESSGNYFHPSRRLLAGTILSNTDEQFDGILNDARDYDLRAEQKRQQAIIDEVEQLRIDKQAEKERKKADRERVARLKPDKKEINLFFARMLNVKPWPAMNQDETNEFLKVAYERISTTVDVLRIELDAL